MKLPLLFLLMIGLVAGVHGQNVKFRTVNGRVTDAGGRPLKNGSIMVFGTNIKTTTDKGGKFSLNFPKDRPVFISIDNHKEPAFMVKVTPQDTFLNVKLNAAARAISTAYLSEANQNDNQTDTRSTPTSDLLPTKDVDTNLIYSAVERQPQFKNSEKDWDEYLVANLRYPESDKSNNVQGKVILVMVVERDGSLTNIKVLKGLSTGCDNEAVRLLKNSPKWKPGIMNGQPVRCYHAFPIKFSLNN